MTMDKLGLDASLPAYADIVQPWTNRRRQRRTVRLLACACLLYFGVCTYRITLHTSYQSNCLSTTRLQQDYATCGALRQVPDDPAGPRHTNKRWVAGTKSVLIRNATVWTGEPTSGVTWASEDILSGKAFAWISADVFVDRGLITKVSSPAGVFALQQLPKDTVIFNADARQLTSGIVDMHSHAGLASLANLQDDVNELSADITPFVRSIDALDPTHPEIQWIKSGGVTTTLLLPGSGNNIGGEAFVVKLATGTQSGRNETSQADMLADADHNWRYMKMACGENPKGVYGRVGERGPFSRLGEAWRFREAFESARAYVSRQDEWCEKARKVGVGNMGEYLPQELRWEALGAVLRGQVRVNVHCYTIADLESFIRLTNEFKFQPRAFHHAHETYLIPDVMKRAWGGTPAAALFADNMYYKVEAYQGSEQAGKILYENNITPVYVSDNPVINAQHVVFEAGKAYNFGLPYHAALAGVTSAPAELLGLGNRVGKIKEGFDADIVVWDSDPLSVAATPVQVWIDGAPQFSDPFVLKKPISPPLKPNPALANTLFQQDSNEATIYHGLSNILHPSFDHGLAINSSNPGVLIVSSNGTIICAGSCSPTVVASWEGKAQSITLKSGYLTPPYIAIGSGLGLVEIEQEPDTHDGSPFVRMGSWPRAVDGLQFQTKQLEAAFKHGVTHAISAPSEGSIEARGVSVGFLTGAKHALEDGAVWQDEVALHYTLSLAAKRDGQEKTALSVMVAELRKKLLDAVAAEAATGKPNENGDKGKRRDPFAEQEYLQRVVSGDMTLIITVHCADMIAAVLKLKEEIEHAVSVQISKPSPGRIKLTILGAAESHLVASSLAATNTSVILAPLLPHAQSWDQRRSLTGAPLTNGTTIDKLLDAGVLVALGVDEVWQTRELGWMAGWAWKNSGGRLSEKKAVELISRNVLRAAGILDTSKAQENVGNSWILWEGNPLEVGSRVRATGSVRWGAGRI